jgi:hypothetical protein
MSTQDAYDLAGSMMGTFSNGYGIVPLDSLLLPYDHPSVVRSINDGAANRKLRVTPATTDPAGQHTSCADDGVRSSVPDVVGSTHTDCDVDADDLANDLSDLLSADGVDAVHPASPVSGVASTGPSPPSDVSTGCVSTCIDPSAVPQSTTGPPRTGNPIRDPTDLLKARNLHSFTVSLHFCTLYSRFCQLLSCRYRSSIFDKFRCHATCSLDVTSYIVAPLYRHSAPSPPPTAPPHPAQRSLSAWICTASVRACCRMCSSLALSQ